MPARVRITFTKVYDLLDPVKILRGVFHRHHPHWQPGLKEAVDILKAGEFACPIEAAPQFMETMKAVLHGLECPELNQKLATPVPGYLVLQSAEKMGNESCLTVHCVDYEAFRCLPQAVEFQGILHGLTGWNSDSQYACYKNTALLARAV